MTGKIALPDLVTPEVMTRKSSASDQLAKLKGVMFLKMYLPGNPMDWSKSSPPLPSVPSTKGAENLLQSRVLWQSMQTMTLLARYLPLAIRSAELVITTSFKGRSEEHTSELQSRENLVCRLLLEKKKK